MRKQAPKFKTMITVLACFCLVASALVAQDKGTIVGTVSETGTEGVLAGANVTIVGTLRGSSVNSDGTYEMKMEPGNVHNKSQFYRVQLCRKRSASCRRRDSDR